MTWRCFVLVCLGSMVFGGPTAGWTQDDKPGAVVIPAEAEVKPQAVTPLTAAYYNFGKVRPPGVPGIDSLDIARDFTKDRAPDTTVTIASGQIDFPPGDTRTIVPNGRPVSEFLFGAATGKPGNGAVLPGSDVNMSSRNVFVLSGCIKVDKPGTYEFRIPCDDAAQMKIGGVLVHTGPEGGMAGALSQDYLSRAEFKAAGVYPVEILYYDKALNAGIEVYSNVSPRGPLRVVENDKLLNLLPFVKPNAAPARSSGTNGR